MSKLNCPAKKTACPCPEYSKEGLCDWPYWNKMTLEENKNMTKMLRQIRKAEVLNERHGKKRY